MAPPPGELEVAASAAETNLAMLQGSQGQSSYDLASDVVCVGIVTTNQLFFALAGLMLALFGMFSGFIKHYLDAKLDPIREQVNWLIRLHDPARRRRENAGSAFQGRRLPREEVK